jgi:predicted peptidase
MRHTPTLLATALALLAPMITTRAQDDLQTVKSFNKTITRTVSARYLLFLPQGYEPKGAKRWPLLLFLHGAGERGSDIWKVAVHGPPKIVKDKPGFPFLLVSPQCPDGETWSDEVVLSLLDEVIAAHAVDTNRVYLTGLSMGGYGTWSLAVRFPQRFAAVAPVCGGGEPVRAYLAGPSQLEALKSLGVWAFHGAKDPVVPLAESQRMIDTLKKIGCGEARLTTYPEAQHDSWTETYNNPDLYEWFLKHSR